MPTDEVVTCGSCGRALGALQEHQSKCGAEQDKSSRGHFKNQCIPLTTQNKQQSRQAGFKRLGSKPVSMNVRKRRIKSWYSMPLTDGYDCYGLKIWIKCRMGMCWGLKSGARGVYREGFSTQPSISEKENGVLAHLGVCRTWAQRRVRWSLGCKHEGFLWVHLTPSPQQA